tara:strand:+ start:13664 stop:14632 length:969 start_codon:yes stop_codon:yes gene_type:complete
MEIDDRIYGSFKIDEGGIIDLIYSQELQRLKGISQQGLPQQFYHNDCFNRYEHSVGVMLLLRKLGASVEEQVAGLLHDVSHTAFSHLIDWVVGDPKTESFQDDNHRKYILSTDLPVILKKFGHSVEDMCNYKKFTLLEQDAPLLCADRVDYTLRELDSDKAKWYVDNLVVHYGRMMFGSKKPAREFAQDYLKLQTEHWAAPESSLRYELFSGLLKDALKGGILCFEDFYQTDQFVVDKLESSANGQTQYVLDLLRKPLEYIFDPNPQFTLQKKFRFVDPEYLYRGRVFQISSRDREFKKLVDKERKKNKEGLSLRLSPTRPR